MTSLIQVPVSKEVAENLLTKIFKYALIKTYHLGNIDPYTFFRIINTPRWKERYVQQIGVYDKLLEDCTNYLEVIPRTEGQVLLPSNVIRFAIELPEFSDEEVAEAINGDFQNTKRLMNLGADEMIASEVLNEFLSAAKIGEVLWSQAFEHCREKKVIEKWQKGKEIQLPKSLDEYQKWEGNLPKQLGSCVSTVTWRLKNELDLKTPHETSYDSYHHPDEDTELERINKIVESEKLSEAMSSVLEGGLSEKQKEVIHLRYWEGLTQEEVARRLQISQQAVSKLEEKAKRKFHKAIDLIPKA